VEVTLLYFDGCPNWREAERRLGLALQQVGLPPSTLTLQRVETPEEAERLAFHGSPTILVNGADPFAELAAPVGLSCRVYRTAGGVDAAPALEQLTEALTAAP
jgi:hypothetical protein